MLDIRPDSRGNKFRAARVSMLKSLIDKTLAEKPKCRVLDAGGTFNFWQVWGDRIDWARTHVTCVNLDPSHAEEGKDETQVKMRQGNACNLDWAEDAGFDVVFSNSVIEHVGQWRDMMAMANEIRRVGRRYLVQTPNYWFPIEPHARTPLLHWLPEPWAYRIVMARQCGFWSKAPSVDQAVRTVQSAKLLDHAQMQALFGDARVVRERFFGLTKSLVALKD